MSDEIIFTREGAIGLVTLNRPQALNALNLGMINALQEQLLLWQDDSRVHAVVVKAEGEKAFCAGGDIRWLYETGLAKSSEQMEFFWHEYRLNHYIHCYKKPYIALMNGVTMGGGVGISMHGSYPVAGERLLFAMPETGIGFFPDIGSSYLLSRCPGQMGIYLGLTGQRLNAHEAYAEGLVKQVIASEQLQTVLDCLIHTDLSKQAHAQVKTCLDAFALEPQSCSEKTSQISVINDCFSKNTIEDIFLSLSSKNDDFSRTTLHHLEQKAPLSLKVTLAQIQRAKSLSMAECVKMDYRLVHQFMKHPDFYEGVRALLIDKDKMPHWQPETLDQATEERVADFFKPCERELVLI